MRDVAREAQVSLKTVSRVVNGEPGVRPDTADRVRVAIEQLGFRPNALASALRRQRSGTIGLVIEDVANPFYSAITRAVEEHARARGLLVMAVSSDENAARERQLVLALCDRRVDGLLVVPASRDHRYLLGELQTGMPAVFVDRPAGGIDVDCVLIDNIGGARAAAEHLLLHGHRRIAMIGDPESVHTSTERLRGFRAGLARHGVELDPRLVRLGSRTVDEAEAVVRELLADPDPPSAVFCGNNRNTVGAIRALAGARRPPALVGFDDFELADLLPVPVTVVSYDPAELGRQAAELLAARMAGGDGPAQTLVVETTLVPRGSGEVAA
jgi:LacI family transcriptional regulator